MLFLHYVERISTHNFADLIQNNSNMITDTVDHLTKSTVYGAQTMLTHNAHMF